jgi:hypothetical protein
LKQGQKVVCIDDRVPPRIRSLYVHWVAKGTTYLVRDVMLAQNSKGEWGEVHPGRAGQSHTVNPAIPRAELQQRTLPASGGKACAGRGVGRGGARALSLMFHAEVSQSKNHPEREFHFFFADGGCSSPG